MGAGARLARDIGSYLEYLEATRRASPHTLAAYRRDLLTYQRWLDATSRRLDRVGVTELEQYVAHLRGTGRAASSVARALVPVRGLHAFLAEEGVLPTDPAADVERPRVPAGNFGFREQVATTVNLVVNGDNPHHLYTAELDECRQFTRTTQGVAEFSEYDFVSPFQTCHELFPLGAQFLVSVFLFNHLYATVLLHPLHISVEAVIASCLEYVTYFCHSAVQC